MLIDQFINYYIRTLSKTPNTHTPSPTSLGILGKEAGIGILQR
jgi:hypothetical protein